MTAIATDWVDPHDPAKGIDTNKQALVTIDADAPTSSVSALPASAPSREFTVSWSGTDTGSGVSGYDIYVSSNDGPWTLWLNNIADTSALFSGYKGTLYAFYSVAHDGAGNVQSTPTNAQAKTTTPENSPPSLVPVSNYFIRAYQTLVVTNIAYGCGYSTADSDVQSGPSAPRRRHRPNQRHFPMDALVRSGQHVESDYR